MEHMATLYFWNIKYLRSVKRITLILLTVIYLVSAVGIGVNRFYCCGELAAVNLVFASGSDQKSDVEKDNCCKTEKQSIKIKDNHFTSSGFNLNQPLPVILPSLYSYDHLDITQAIIQSRLYQSNAPPGSPEVPIYTLNCTYRI
ncbi:MAG: hypothetical protein JWP67_1036 [Mucilaginibacter sp.]|nr:hypothetical protein [Mucilaginibacter sp.]